VSQNTQSSKQSTSTQNTSNQSTQHSSTQNNNKQNSHNTSTVNNTSTKNNSSNSNSSSGTSTYVKIAQANINGQMTNVLTTGNGMTLYYDTNDTALNATCTGGCAQTWPPFLAQGQIITSAGVTSGQVTEQATANGNQVEYNGHPLYTYVNDTTTGQVNGQGVNSIWYAAASVTTQKLKW
jgi:predicted lipoprotein with Yx(FWY)xxD motif